jgi:dTDP-glucose 4,6-dehydratase
MNPLAEDLDHMLAHTWGLWEELRGQRIFITGGTGFFGCWLLESFLWANGRLQLGAEAVVLTRDPAAFRERVPHLASHPAVRLHQGDIADFSFPDGTFSYAIHAASELNVAQLHGPADSVDRALQGVRRVLELARQNGVRKLLMTSSGAVYGPAAPVGALRREEEDGAVLPSEARWAYAETKRRAEHLFTQASNPPGLETKIARGFAFIGPYLQLDAHLAAGNFLRDVLRGVPLTLQSSGNAVRSYLHGADLALWLWTILFRGAPGRAFNVGSDVPVAIAELARKVASEGEPPVPVNVLGRSTPGEAVDFYVPDIRRARAELGLDVFIPLDEAIRRTLRWHRLEVRI